MQDDAQLRDERQASRRDRGDFARRAGRHAFGIARTLMPDVDFRTWNFGRDDGRRIFEFAGQNTETGQRVEVDVFANGRVEEVEMEIPLSAVPQSIKNTVANTLNGYRARRAERSIRRNFRVFYEIDGETMDGEPLSVEVSATGGIFRIERPSAS
jgi:hypothetical protein